MDNAAKLHERITSGLEPSHKGDKGATGWRGNVWRLTIYPDVFEYLPDVGAEDTERNDANLPTTYRAQQWENLVDASGWIGQDD